MKKKHRIKKTITYFWYYVLAAILLFVFSIIASYIYFKPVLETDIPFIDSIESQIPVSKTDGEGSDRLYSSVGNSLTDGDGIRRGNLLVTAEDVIKNHMESYSVKLLDLYMDAEGVIYADFSSDLMKSFQGDASEEHQLISGLYDKLSTSIPGFTALKILINGKEADSFGGHIDISRPIGREIRDVIQNETNRYF